MLESAAEPPPVSFGSLLQSAGRVQNTLISACRIYEAGNIVGKFTRGAIGPVPISGGEVSLRYADRGIIGALLGPTIGRVEHVSKAIGGAVSGEMREPDVKPLRRPVPFQNVFYLRRLFAAAHEGAADAVVADEQ